MSTKMSRGVKEGLGFGVLAGVVFAMMEIVGAAMMGNPPLMPVRMFASVVLGQEAMQSVSLGAAVLVGIPAHLVFSGLFGLLYGVVNARLSTETETSWGRQVALGLTFGALIWLVNFQIVASFLYPWFQNAPQALQLLMHAAFFGLPLGLMYAAAERKAQHGHIGGHATTA